MDGSVVEHSDSDSGDSWTLLDNAPAYSDDGSDFVDHAPRKHGYAENVDKDEDTDGISVISDSDPESITACDLSFDKSLLEGSRPTEQLIPEIVSIEPLAINNNNDDDKDDHKSIRDDEDLLGDKNVRLKTYVHKRNQRVSTMLNIIVLGSVITAAGVAIGHMWGARNDCLNSAPSVNKILSNLYKLQEENVYLRNKVKELTLLNNIHNMHHRRGDNDRTSFKQHKCKKVFEESLTNRDVDRLTKCVDNEINKHTFDSLITDNYQKELLSDIDKLKNVYQQNKSWLDEEIARRMKHEQQYMRKLQNNLKSPKSIRINEEHKRFKNVNLKLENISESPPEVVINVTEPAGQPLHVVEVISEMMPEKKITYADSLKSVHKVVKRAADEDNPEKTIKDFIRRKKPRKELDTVSENSEQELIKDDRYVPHKIKIERKKNDRHKIHKKQKRRNKYEQWEMKGGYMKDYDDFSITSSHENEFILKNPDKNHLSRDFERNNYIHQFAEVADSKKSPEVKENPKSEKPQIDVRVNKREKNKEKEVNWYDKRATLRSEARKKLEQELFGESSPNNAQWYFRRMQRREQCRVKGDNSTYKKFSKRMANYKTKH